MKNIQVLLVDAKQDIRSRITTILKKEKDIHLVSETGSSQEVMEKIKVACPDVVVLELSQHGKKAVEIRLIVQAYRGINVLVLSEIYDERGFFEIMASGVRGYVAKKHLEELAVAIRLLHEGKPYFCAEGRELLMKGCLTQ